MSGDIAALRHNVKFTELSILVKMVNIVELANLF